MSPDPTTLTLANTHADYYCIDMTNSPEQPGPEGMTDRYVDTTGGERIMGLRDESNGFFIATLKDLGVEIERLSDFPFAEVHERSLEFTGSDDRLYPSEENVITLTVFDEVLAMVFDRRNNFNNHEVTFWQRVPSEACQASIDRAL